MVSPLYLLDNIDSDKIILKDKEKAIINRSTWESMDNEALNCENISLDELLLFIINENKTYGG